MVRELILAGRRALLIMGVMTVADGQLADARLRRPTTMRGYPTSLHYS